MEFGVWNGLSAREFYNGLRGFYGKDMSRVMHWRMYLFDTFYGLPEPKDERDEHRKWHVGKYNAKGVGNFIDLMTRKKAPRNLYKCVAGKYEDTLKQFCLEDTYPDIVHIDCDYYSSTKAVLDWLESHIEPSTLVRFDDLDAFPYDETKGQLGALLECGYLEEVRNLGRGEIWWAKR